MMNLSSIATMLRNIEDEPPPLRKMWHPIDHKGMNMEQRNPLAYKTKIATCLLLLAATSMIAAFIYGCAPQEPTEPAAAQSTDAATSIQGDFSFSADADCSVCHETEGASMNDPACPASNHAAQTCTACHSDIDGLTAAHDGVAYGDKVAKRLKTTEVAESTCLTESCHGSYDELAETTSSSTILTDSNGTVVNPHALSESADHDTVDCGSCHDMHSSDDINATAPKACQGCHHMGVYECNTCHD